MADLPKATPTKPRKLKDVAQWDLETDTVIVGFGGAGACAAIEAADAGCNVLLLELSSASGGSTALSSAEIYMGGNGGTRVQKACGFEDDTEDMFQFLMMAGGEMADEAKVRAYCEGSLDHFNWLTDKGVPYKDSFFNKRAVMAHTDDCILYTGNEKAYPFVEKAKPCPRGHNLQVDGDNGGPLLMKILTENIEARSDKIRIEYETRVLSLIADEDNAVQGVVIRMNQQELNVKAHNGVILCAGGFVMNEKMVSKFAPKLQRGNMPIGNPGDTGTGIQMGMSVGGAAINMDEGFISLPFYPPTATTYGILVNRQGQRFINEDCYHGRVGHFILNQPSDRIFFILHATEDFKAPIFLGADIAGTGETIEELEEEIGIEKGALSNTLDFFNKHAAEGNDPLFHKSSEYTRPIEAPYVALDCTPGRGAIYPYFTLGGLDTLPSGEVLTANGEVIPGLFAAGRTACGIPRNAKGYGSGMSVGDATFSGRMAGKAVAANKPRES